MSKYNVGDKILNISTRGEINDGKRGEIALVKDGIVYVRYEDGNAGQSEAPEVWYKIINNARSNNLIMNTINKFLDIFASEPQKSLKKAGLVDEKGIATADGVSLFVTYQFRNLKETDPFFTDVVAKLAAEDEEKKK